MIQENLRRTNLANRARVHQMPVERFIAGGTPEPYDIIIMDPPYASPTIEVTIEAIAGSNLIRGGTILVVGHWPRLSLREGYGCFQQLTSRRIGDSSFSIYECESED